MLRVNALARTKWARFTLGTALVTSATTAAFAQNTAENSTEAPQEIIVTGSRIPAPNLESTSPIQVVTSQEIQQGGWIQTVGPNPNPMQITGGATLSGNNFGNFHTVRITGHKFEDKNGNGVQDSGEGPIAGITIKPSSILARNANPSATPASASHFALARGIARTPQ